MSWADSFDPELLDQNDPSEIDAQNIHHRAKHAPFTSEDLLDALFDRPIFVPALHRPAELLMIAEIPGDMIVVPVMQAKKPTQIRPIGIYRAGAWHERLHRREYD